jgi:hypothetical protein
MGKKSKVSADGTYVFDSDDLDELDDLSLTSVMGEVADAIQEKLKQAEERAPSDEEDQLNFEEAMSSGTDSEEKTAEKQEDAPDAMIPPELLITEDDPDADR